MKSIFKFFSFNTKQQNSIKFKSLEDLENYLATNFISSKSGYHTVIDPSNLLHILSKIENKIIIYGTVADTIALHSAIHLLIFKKGDHDKFIEIQGVARFLSGHKDSFIFECQLSEHDLGLTTKNILPKFIVHNISSNALDHSYINRKFKPLNVQDIKLLISKKYSELDLQSELN